MNTGPEQRSDERNAGQDASAVPEPFAPDPALEAALRQALVRVPAPAGFAERVLSRAHAGDVPRPRQGRAPAAQVLSWPRRLWITGAIAAALVAGIFEGGLLVHQAQEKARQAAEATRQFETTERVTLRALAQARDQLQRAGVSLDLN